MAGCDSKIIAVRVRENDSVILDWYAIQVDSSHTFSSLFDQLIFASSRGTPGTISHLFALLVVQLTFLTYQMN